MKKSSVVTLILLCCLQCAGFAQQSDSTEVTGQDSAHIRWDITAEYNSYFFSDQYIGLPVVRADYNKLHFEARYNYEDLETFSAWAGFNFSGGNEFEYFITPMTGVVLGNSNGVGAGMEVTFSFRNFELYSEGEYFWDSEDDENNFAYSFTDFSYTFHDQFWVGLSAQRTRLFETDLDLQRGILAGGMAGNWEFTSYLFNLFQDEPYGILTVAYTF